MTSKWGGVKIAVCMFYKGKRVTRIFSNRVPVYSSERNDSQCRPTCVSSNRVDRSIRKKPKLHLFNIYLLLDIFFSKAKTSKMSLTISIKTFWFFT